MMFFAVKPKKRKEFSKRSSGRSYGIWSLTIGLSLLVSASSLATAQESLKLHWTNNLLTISGPDIPGSKLEIWYLEAFCHRGSTHRDWSKTVLPHKTQLISPEPHCRLLATTV